MKTAPWSVTFVLAVAALTGCGGASNEGASSGTESAPTGDAPPGVMREGASVSGQPAVEVEGSSCALPDPEAELAPDATLAGGSWPYTLEMVATRGDSAGSIEVGVLLLMPHTAEMQVVRGMDGEPIPGASSPLFGPTNIDLGALGAYPMGGLDSRDPEAPGAGVYEMHSGEGPPSIIVRFGSAANRRSGTPIDGATTALHLTAIDEAGFSGRWQSASNAEVRASGYFCATRIQGSGG
ncbi:MAG: hypothetical protein RQ745_08085 [Longimicrobiales bacterium]|nr:hypothetical protein [Longimicrobiales bacterium]